MEQTRSTIMNDNGTMRKRAGTLSIDVVEQQLILQSKG